MMIDLKAEVANGVTVQNLIDALCHVLDGVPSYHLQDLTGLTEETCEKISEIRAAVDPYCNWDGDFS